VRLDDLSRAEKRWRKVSLFRDHRPVRSGIGWLLVLTLVCASLLTLAFGGFDLELHMLSKADPALVLDGPRKVGDAVAWLR
jgi:hypothetical protein